jgi:hypothetical protein
MSAFKLSRPATKPEDLICKVIPGEGAQANIENNHRKLQDFDREYIAFGGFFGAHNPAVFAAAPELLALVIQYRDDLLYPPPAVSRERRLMAIAVVLARTGAAS